MNPVIQFFTRPLVQIIIIIVLLSIIIWLVSENFSNISDTFTSDAFNRRPPHIEQLPHQQLVPQDPPAASQNPSSSDRDGMSRSS